MTPRQLTLFLAVCRHRSMSKAAEEMNIAQPSLSKQIVQLEHALKTPLFVRHHRGVDLTRPGERLRTEAAELVRRIDNLSQAIRSESEHVSGDVTLCVITSLASAFAVELLPKIAADMPKVKLRILNGFSDQAVRDVLQQNVDLAIIPNTAADLPVAASMPLFKESFVFISRSSPQFPDRPIRLADALDRPLVLPPVGSDLRRRVDEGARSIGVQLTPLFETNSIEAIGELVELGIACSVVPRTYWQGKIAAGAVDARPIEAPRDQPGALALLDARYRGRPGGGRDSQADRVQRPRHAQQRQVERRRHRQHATSG